MNHRRRFALLTLALFVYALPAKAAFDPDPAKGTWFEQALREARTRANIAVIDAPGSEPTTVQNESPSATGVSASIVDRGSFTTLLATVLENAVGAGSEDQAITFDLNLFALAALTDSSLLADNDRYHQYAGLRRVAGAVTLGGKPDESAAPAPANRPRNITDIVHVQAKWRFWGSRDRRDHWDRYRRLSLMGIEADLLEITQLPELKGRLGGNDEEKYEALADVLSKHPELIRKLDAQVTSYTDGLRALNQEIDRNFVATFNVTGDFRNEALGKDKFYAELVAEEGNVLNLTTNIGFRSDEATDGGHDRELKVAIAASKKLLQAGPIAPNGLDASLGVSGQMRNNHRASIWSANTKFNLPLENKLGLLVSLTWASRSDLIKEDAVRGNFGLTYDFGERVQ